MNQPGKKSGCGNRGKTNYVFPPFPQPLLLLTNQDEKSNPPKQKTIVYTKSLADPGRGKRPCRRMNDQVFCLNLAVEVGPHA